MNQKDIYSFQMLQKGLQLQADGWLVSLAINLTLTKRQMLI
ncbi:MAG TPA: hypothetical protein VK625_20655 [Flavitalea sp.]|nr:hypothetical protein [Flavitalea sp.]